MSTLEGVIPRIDGGIGRRYHRPVARVLAIVALAIVAAGVAFVVTGMLDGRYPFGPDRRPICGGTPEGILPGCFAGPLDDRWFEPFMWPAIAVFALVVGIGLVALNLVERRERDEAT